MNRRQLYVRKTSGFKQGFAQGLGLGCGWMLFIVGLFVLALLIVIL